MANYSNITIPPTYTVNAGPYTGNITIAGGGSGTVLTSPYIISGTGLHVGSASSWTTQTSPNMTVGKVKITESDIELDGMSLRETLKTLQDRLAILVPDPKKLKEFEALKQAYEHYKTLEALCCSAENADKK
jgi:hypothetical protein